MPPVKEAKAGGQSALPAGANEGGLILLIDADDTLLDFKRSERACITATLKNFRARGVQKAARLFSAVNKACWLAVERGERTREEIAVLRFEELLGRLPLQATAEQLNEFYKACMRRAYFLLPGAKRFLHALKARRHRLFLITNGLQTTQRLRVKGSGIEEFFEDVFISESMGTRKPERAYFEAVERLIPDFRPELCYVIGDSLTADIKGAENAGLPSIWFDPENKPAKPDITPTYTAHSYADIVRILDAICLSR